MRELGRLNSLFELSLYALILIPFGMIVAGGAVGPVMAMIFAIGIPVSHWAHLRGFAKPSQSALWSTIVVLFVVGSGAELLLTEQTILDAGIRLVLVLILIKLFSRLSERDELQIFALSFLLLAAATTVNEELTFGLLFAAYVLVGTFSLAVFHLRSELSARPRLVLYGGVPLNRSYIAVLVGMSGIILASSLAIFFLFPRLGLGFFAQQSRDGVSVTGFSEHVELGGHGAIRDNPEVVMRVEFPDGRWPDAESIHWRTMTFDEYDGRAWARSRRGRPRTLPRSGGHYDLTDVHPSDGERGQLQIYLEPLGTNILPVVWPARAARLGTTEFVMPWGPRSGALRVDRYGDLRHTIESELGIAYVLTVGTEPTRREQLEAPRDRYLQVPALTSRVRTLATEIAADVTDVDQRATEIRDHLQSNYDYTTDLPPVGDDPVDSFLFETRRGHCEYFATTMVMLLRANGIHARLVNGFLGGKWNDVGGYLAVRQGDAHSWVEYWSPGIGWVPIDPTPASESLMGGGFVDSAREYWDTMRLYWTKWVIEYDLNAQIEVFRQLGRMIEPRGLMNDEKRDQESAVRENDWRKALLIGGLATLVFFAFIRTRRRLRRRDGRAWVSATALVWIGTGSLWFAWFEGLVAENFFWGAAIVSAGVAAAILDPTRWRSGDAPLRATFETIEDAAQKSGLGRSVDEGPESFLRRLAAQRPAIAEDLRRFETWYLRARFGESGPNDEDIDRLRRIAGRISTHLRKN